MDQASLESRVKALEHEVRWLREDLTRDISEVNGRVGKLSTELREENTKRQTETRELKELLERVHIGGLDLEVAGLAWILFGEIVGTRSVQLAPFALWSVL